MFKFNYLVKAVTAFTAIGLLSACAVVSPQNESVDLYEGKVSVVGKDHIINEDSDSLLSKIKGDTDPESWQVELLLDRVDNSVIFIPIDKETFKEVEVGQSFCYSNVNEKITMDQIHGDDSCKF